MGKDDEDNKIELRSGINNRSIHSTNLPGLNPTKKEHRQPYGKVIDLSNFGDDTANGEEEKQVVQSAMHQNDDPLNLSDNTREMVKQPVNLGQAPTNNIDEMERLLQQIDGSANGGTAAASIGNGLTASALGGNGSKEVAGIKGD